MTLVLLLGSCACPSGGLAGEEREYMRLLAAQDLPTEERIERCLDLADSDLAGDCALTAAEAAPALENGRIETWCVRLPVGIWQEECYFLAAEEAMRGHDRKRATHLCLQSGRFTDECGYHLWQLPLRALVHQDGPAGFAVHLDDARALYDAWAARLAASTDIEFRFWSRYFEMGFEPQPSVRLEACDPVEEPYRTQCLVSGTQVWRHRLENATIAPEAREAFCARTAPEASVRALLAERADVPPVPGLLDTTPSARFDEALAFVRASRCR